MQNLEERVAELEATTARKGNRKVSLRISGQVNKALVWDPRNVNDVEVWDSVLSQSRFRFTGGAKVTSDVHVGFIAEFGIRDENLIINECRQCNWFIKIKNFW